MSKHRVPLDFKPETLDEMFTALSDPEWVAENITPWIRIPENQHIKVLNERGYYVIQSPTEVKIGSRAKVLFAGSNQVVGKLRIVETTTKEDFIEQAVVAGDLPGVLFRGLFKFFYRAIAD